MDTNSVGLGDAMLLAQNRDGFNGGWWVWIFLIFFLMGGNGLWGNNQNSQTVADLAAAKTQSTIWQSNDQQNLMGAIGQVRDGNIALGNGIADATFALNQAVNNGFTGAMRDNFALQTTITGGMNNIAQGINENRFAGQQGFSNVSHAIEDVKYANALNTCNITTNSTANTQKILDRLTEMEMDAKNSEIANLRAQLSQANLTVSQYDQNATLVNAIRPFPTAAYLVGNPYTNYNNAGTCPYAG